MQACTVVFGLAAGVLAGLLAAPDASDEALQRCLRECGTSSETDAETCRLQCRQRAERGEAPIEHWKRVELKGGSPDPNVEGGSTTTVTKRGPDGTTTTVTKVDRAGKTTVTRFEGGEAEVYAAAAFGTGVGGQAWCWVGCSTKRTVAARTTCRSRCPRVTAGAVRGDRAEAKQDPAACRDACTTRAQRCHAACPAANADRATCKLQCDEGAASCRKRC
jgi:hypothetical protein